MPNPRKPAPRARNRRRKSPHSSPGGAARLDRRTRVGREIAAPQIGQIDHHLRRAAGHQRGRRRLGEVHAMDHVLDRHRATSTMPVTTEGTWSPSGNGPHAQAITAARRPATELRRQQCARHGGARSCETLAGVAHEQDHQAEHRQREQLGDDLGTALHEARPDGHEVAGDMRGEQPLQGEEAGGIDIAAVEGEEVRGS